MISICVGSVRSGSVGALIESIVRQPEQDWELIVVAQGDDQRLLDEISRRSAIDKRIRLIHMRQFGRSRALNAGIAVAQGDIIAFTDDDCEVSSDWLLTIKKCFYQEREVGILAGDLVPNRAKGIAISTCPAAHTIEYIYRPSEVGYEAPGGFYWIGGNVAIRRDAIEKIGPFDEYLGVGTEFPACEDVDYGLRAEELNVATWTTPQLRVFHTYGRRYGLKSFLKHHRGYALGQGALNAKLEMWGHRLVNAWGGTPSNARIIRDSLKNPSATLKFYTRKYREEGRKICAAKYELGPGRLLKPKQQKA
ncbi:MAG: glycosyltransferase [Chloroflexales bacterium]|nr:glycosyltransferase [Chloroflexales bacterium]